MKQFLAVFSLLVFVFSAAAYTGYSGVNTVSGEEVEEGNDWRIEFRFVPSTSEERLNHSTEGNKTSVTGSLMLRNGCVNPKYSFNKTGDNSYRLNVYSVENSAPNVVCTQAIRYQGYEASLEAERPYTLTVNSEGSNTTEIVNRKKSGSQFNVVNFLMRLFK